MRSLFPKAALHRSELLVQAGETRIQTLSCFEQGERGIEVPELAERDAGAAQHHRLTRLRFEDLHGSVGNRHQNSSRRSGGGARRGGKSALEQNHPRVIDAIRILQPAGIREQPPVSVDLATGQQLLGPSA